MANPGPKLKAALQPTWSRRGSSRGATGRVALSPGQRGVMANDEAVNWSKTVLGPELSVENAELVRFGHKMTQRCHL